MPTREGGCHRAHRTSLDLSTGARPETRWGNDAVLAQGLNQPAACTHSPSATTMRSLRSLSIIPGPTISVRPTLAPLYQFYRDTSLPAVPLLSRHSHLVTDRTWMPTDYAEYRVGQRNARAASSAECKR